MDTAAWRSLSAQDRAVYVEIARVYKGSNNGFLSRSVRQLSSLANINKDTVSRCLGRLVERGFLECATPGGFSRKTPHAAEWRLTVHRCDRTGTPPTKAFLDWRPEIQNAVRNEGPPVRAKGTVTAPLEVGCPKTGDNNGNIASPTGPSNSDTYTSSHRLGRAHG